MTPASPSNGATITTTIAIPTDALTVVAAPPEMISQRNVEAVAGIPARVYLELIRAPAFPVPVSKLGKLRLVPRAEFVEYLRGLANQQANGMNDVDWVLASAGLQRRR